MANPTMEDRLEWTIADNAKKAIEIADLHVELERVEKLLVDIIYTAKKRKEKMHQYRDALNQITAEAMDALR